MRLPFLAICIIFSHISFAQSPQIAFDSARAMLDRNDLEPAIPYFQQVMDNGDEALKRKAINYLTTTWVTVHSSISLSKSKVSYGKFLSDYMTANFTGKESTMTAADHYTAGMIFWSFAYAGAVKSTGRAIYQLNAAAKGGYSDAIYYLAEAVKQMKHQDPSIQWADIVDLYRQASVARKSPQPLIELANSKLADLRWTSYKTTSTPADLDTSKEVFLLCLYNIMETMPDSFHVAVNRCWERSFDLKTQDTAITNLLNSYFVRVNVPVTSPAGKGYAWHRLYQYFYDATPSKQDKQAGILQALKAYYNNDKALLSVIAEFLNTADPHEIGFAFSLHSKWLTNFSPMQIIEPESFFRAAAMTEQDYLPFLGKNAPAGRFAKNIAAGYKTRFNRLFDIISGDAIDEKYRYALGETGSAQSLRTMEKLSALPDMSGQAAIRYAYADMAVLNNLASYAGLHGGIPISFNELPKVYSGWSAADKQAYNKKYINFLLKKVQELINERNGVNSLAQANGKSSLDLNDYDKAQKTINQVNTILQ